MKKFTTLNATIFLLVATCQPLSTIEVRAGSFSWEVGAVSSNWDSAANWDGPLGHFPDGSNDVAHIDGSHPNMPVLTGDRVVGALTLSNQATLRNGDGVNNFDLRVSDTGGLLGTTNILDPLTELAIYPSGSIVFPDFQTEHLTIDRGDMRSYGADVRVQENAFIRHLALYEGDGTLNVVDGALTNNGVIRAARNTLRVYSSGSGVADLDGTSEQGQLRVAQDSTLIIDMPLAGAFDGTVRFGPNAELRINQPLIMGGTSELTFLAVTQPSTVSGSGDLTVHGLVEIGPGGAIFARPTTFGHAANIQIDDHGSLQFDAMGMVNNPESIHHTGNGTELIVNDVVHIGTGTGTFDWDGSLAATASTTVNPNGTLFIDVERIDTGVETFHGTLTLNSGDIDVRNADSTWRLGGAVHLNNTNHNSPILAGDSVIVSGEVYVGGSGASIISASPSFEPGSFVQVQESAALWLNGTTNYIQGGTWTGEGTVSITGPTAVTEPTMINMPAGRFDLDGFAGTHIVSMTRPLTLQVEALDADNRLRNTVVVDGALGQLDVQFTAPNNSYAIDGSLLLRGPLAGLPPVQLAGADVELAGTTIVTGHSASEAVLNFLGDTTIGALGSLNLHGGTRQNPNMIAEPARILGDGELVVADASFLQMADGAHIDVHLENNGTLAIGTPRGTASIDGSYIQTTSGAFDFEFAGLPDDDQDRLEVTGAVVLAGDLNISLADGFIPTAGEVYTVISGGVLFSEFDSVNTNGGGVVDFDVLMSYAMGDAEFGILSVDVLGDFNDDFSLDCADIDALVAEVAAGGANLQFDLNADGLVNTADVDHWLDAVGTFQVGSPYLPGDANLDGVVDGVDFVEWNTNKFTATPAWCSGDFNADGQVDGIDFVLWNGNKFVMSDHAIAVPETRGVTLLLFICALIVRRRIGQP